MSHSKALQELIETCPQVVLAFQARRDLEALEADARALWAVRVLDAEADKSQRPKPLTPRRVISLGAVEFCINLPGGTKAYGPTPGAVRIAVATALVATDPLLDPDQTSERCTRELPKALAPRGHVYEHGRCRQCNVSEPPAVGYGQPSARATKV